MIMLIWIHSIGFAGTIKLWGGLFWVSGRSHSRSMRIEITNVFFLVENKVVRAGELVGKTTTGAFVVDVRIMWVNNKFALFVSFADGRICWFHWRNGRWACWDGGRWVSFMISVRWRRWLVCSCMSWHNSGCSKSRDMGSLRLNRNGKCCK